MDSRLFAGVDFSSAPNYRVAALEKRMDELEATVKMLCSEPWGCPDEEAEEPDSLVTETYRAAGAEPDPVVASDDAEHVFPPAVELPRSHRATVIEIPAPSKDAQYLWTPRLDTPAQQVKLEFAFSIPAEEIEVPRNLHAALLRVKSGRTEVGIYAERNGVVLMGLGQPVEVAISLLPGHTYVVELDLGSRATLRVCHQGRLTCRTEYGDALQQPTLKAGRTLLSLNFGSPLIASWTFNNLYAEAKEQ